MDGVAAVPKLAGLAVDEGRKGSLEIHVLEATVDFRRRLGRGHGLLLWLVHGSCYDEPHIPPRRTKGRALDIVAKTKTARIGRELKVVLPEGEEERILASAQQLSEAGMARPVLLGPEAVVRERAAAMGLRLGGLCEVRDPQKDGALAAYAKGLASGRAGLRAGMA